MQRFIAVRVFQSLLAILVMSLIVFGLARLSGNPLDVMLPIEALPEDYERLEKHWGLDKPVATQYVIFITKALQGDFGQSLKYQGKSAMDLVAERLPATLELAGFALLVSVILALPIGVLAAVAKGSNWDTAAKIVALLGQSLPAFWLGIVLMWIFAVMLPGCRLRAGAGSSTSSCPPSRWAGSRSPSSCGWSARPCWRCSTASS